jgi:tetratricopeptide (TPR) repeat protein
VGDYARSRSYSDQVLSVADEFEDPYLMALGLSCRADATLALGEATAAQQDAERSLEVACKAGNVERQGRAHMGLGSVYRWLGDPAATHDHYAQALQLLRQLGGPGRSMAALAGLAWAELALGRLREAQGHAAEILAHLDGGYRPDVTGRPFSIYLTCYQVLSAAGDPRAAEILTWTHSLLQEWADNAPDEETRRSFLEDVAENRALVREWQLARQGEAGEG